MKIMFFKSWKDTHTNKHTRARGHLCCCWSSGPAFAHRTTGAKRTVALPHTWTTMCQQRYGGKAEMWSVQAMLTFSCTEISGVMLQCYVLTCGWAVTAFSEPPWSWRPGQGPRSPHPKASPVDHVPVFWI
jgi:hypothetical protein